MTERLTNDHQRTGMSTEIWALAIAGVALIVSVGTATGSEVRYRRQQARADVSVRLQWLETLSRVDIGEGRERHAGYNIVLENRGPGPAMDLHLEVSAILPSGEHHPLSLKDVDPDEFPLDMLPAGSKYPIRFIDTHELDRRRRFVATVAWRDHGGDRHELAIPLRRGNVGSP